MARVDQRSLQRRMRIASILLMAIVVLGALFVGQSIVSGSVFGSSYRLTLNLPDAAGLHPRSDVAYRGQHIGSVTAISITPDGVRATVSINGNVRLPKDTTPVVADLSGVGEQYLDLRPNVDHGPWLADGDALTVTPVLPIATWKVLADLQTLLSHIDVNDVQTISREVSAIFGPGDVHLPELVGEIQKSLTLAEQLSPEVFGLLRTANTPLTTLNSLTPQMRSIVQNAQKIAHDLAAADPALAALINQGAAVIPVISNFVEQTTPVVVDLLADGTPIAVMAGKHIPGLEHWYAWGPSQLNAMADSTRDGTGHVVLVITPAKNCLYGPPVSPYQNDVPLPINATCTTVAPDIQQRGAQNVPQQ